MDKACRLRVRIPLRKLVRRMTLSETIHQDAGGDSLKISVIVNTYENPRALRLVFAGLRYQVIQPFEIIVADDGSSEETRETIRRLSKSVTCPVIHVWQPHDGFRKCRILNRAIIEAQGNYIIFFDGDCIPRRSCIATHVRLARKNRYITGGIVRLAASFSDQLIPEAVEQGVLERLTPWSPYVDKPKRLLLSRIPVLRELMDHMVKRNPGWRGGNASTYRENLIKVGGFDERFSYGYEDADLGHRLHAIAIRGRSIRYTEPVFHVEHPRSYVSETVVRTNYLIYRQNRENGVARTPYGIPDPPDRLPKDYIVTKYG